MAAVLLPELIGQLPAAPLINVNEESAAGGNDLPDPIDQGLPILLGHVRVHDHNGFVSPHTASLWISKPRWRTGARMGSVPTIKKGLARLKANPVAATGGPSRNRTWNHLIKSQVLCLVELTARFDVRNKQKCFLSGWRDSVNWKIQIFQSPFRARAIAVAVSLDGPASCPGPESLCPASDGAGPVCRPGPVPVQR